MVRYRQDDNRERAAAFMMKGISRRTVFRGSIGVTGGAVMTWLLGKGLVGDSGRALAGTAPKGRPEIHMGIGCIEGDCPPAANGVCSCVSSSCITGGRRCNCVCSSACGFCDPVSVMAECSWQWVSGHCYFSCRCVAC